MLDITLSHAVATNPGQPRIPLSTRGNLTSQPIMKPGSLGMSCSQGLNLAAMDSASAGSRGLRSARR